MTEMPFDMDTILRHKSEELHTALGLKLGHPVSQGDLSEGEWRNFLKKFLPNRYDVSKGFVFDSAGGVSQQIDLIVFDPFHSPLIHETDNGEKYVTAESVYAIFEVKQKADKSTVKYADEKIQSVVNLKRTSRPMISSGKLVPARSITHIIGGLLTTDSVSQRILKKHLGDATHVDIICSASGGTLHKSGSGISASSAEEALFAFFYLLLDELYKLGTVGAIDIRDYADRSLTSFALKREEPADVSSI